MHPDRIPTFERGDVPCSLGSPVFRLSISTVENVIFRKGIDGLATLVKEQFHLDPFQKEVLFLSADAVPTGSKAWSGKAMGSACFISGLKPDASDGREARKKRQGSHRKNFIFC